MSESTILMNLGMTASSFFTSVNKVIGKIGGMTAAFGAAGLVIAYFGQRQMRYAIDAAEEFEVSLARLEKLVGRELAEPMAMSVRKLSRELPIATAELYDVTESALRLGIRGSKNVMLFSETMAKIGVVTDVTAEMAAENFARIAAVTGQPIENVDRLADTMNDLSDTMATSFAEIMHSAGELAPVMTLLGATAPEIFGVSAAVNEVNISVRRGAQRLRSFIQQLDETKRAPGIAQSLGITTEAFREMIENDPTGTLLHVVDVMREGGEKARVFAENFDSAGRLGIAALSQNKRLAEVLEQANDQFERGGSVNEQYAAFMEIARSKGQLLENQIDDLRVSLGQGAMPLRHFWLNTLISLAEHARGALAAITNESVLSTKMSSAQVSEIRDSVSGLLANTLSPIADREEFKYLQRELANRIEDTAFGAMEALDGSAPETLVAFFEGQRRLLATLKTGGFGEGEEGVEGYNSAILDLVEGLTYFNAALKENERQLAETGEETDKYLEAIKGLDDAMFLDAMANFGFAEDEITKDIAQAIVALQRQKIAFEQGEEAAAIFERRINGMAESSARRLTAAEAEQKAREELREQQEEEAERLQEQTEAYEEQIVALEENIRVLQGYGDEVRMEQLLREHGNMSRAKTIFLLEQEAEALKEANAAAEAKRETVNGFIESLENEIATMRHGADELRLREALMYAADDAERAFIRSLVKTRDELSKNAEELEEARRVLQRIQDIKDRLTFNTLEKQLERLDRLAGNLSSAFMDTFEAMIDGAEDATVAIRNMIRQIMREFIEMQIRTGIFNALEQRANIGGQAEAKLTGDAGSKKPDLSKGKGKSAPVNITVNSTYEIKALDSQDVSSILSTQAEFIANQTVGEINRSQALRRALARS